MRPLLRARVPLTGPGVPTRSTYAHAWPLHAGMGSRNATAGGGDVDVPDAEGATSGARQVAAWWAALLGEEEHAKRWRRLFETSDAFRKWVLKHGVGAGGATQPAFVKSLQKHYANGTVPPYTAARFLV